MDWQFKVGLGAAFVFGLLPYAVKDMPHWVTWPGLGMGIAFTAWGLIPSSQKIPLGPAVLFIVGLIVIIGAAGWYKDMPSSLHKPWKNTLEELYASDFSDLLNLEKPWSVTTPFLSPNAEPIKIQVRFRLYQDFRSHTDFASLYVPKSNDARIDADTNNLLRVLRDKILSGRGEIYASVGVGFQSPGTDFVEAKNLNFSGRVFIYTDHAMTVTEIADLTRWYQAANMFLEVRGYQYWIANKDR